MADTLVLYHFEDCPFCKKVRDFISDEGIEGIEFRDIKQDESAAETLMNGGGKRQVPCLFINGAPLYESGDIINWLSDHC